MRSVEGDLPTRDFYRNFASHEAGDSPVFTAWAAGVAEDDEVLALLTELPEPKRQPNLVFAAARAHGAEASRPDYAPLRKVLTTRWPAVRSTIESRSTQTNEAARCATLLPALSRVEGPVALLEVGAAAGLCLLPDRYSYRFTGDAELTLDPVDGPSSVVLECELRGLPAPERLPEVVWRGGLDLNPLDVRDREATDWLETLVWPEHEERRERLRAAVGVARSEEIHLVRGDLLAGLPALVAQARRAAPGATVVVQHSAVLAYVPPRVRAEFADLVRAEADLWLANEGARILPGMPRSPRASSFVLAQDGTPAYFTHHHGRWAQAL